MAVLERAGVPDLPGLYRVCRLTADRGGDATARHTDPDLLGHVWAGPYLLFPDAEALVVRDAGGVAGYCVGVPDTASFEDWLETTWLPPLRRCYPAAGLPGHTAADRALVRRLHAWPRTDPAVLRAHPAHLHVDLLPRVQGRGWGRRVVGAVLAALAAGGARGLHLGVDPENTGALAFYARLGFTRVADDPAGGVVLATPLGPTDSGPA
jgi:ribosomal protein S18 acetylase RimI-like enzyme